MDLTSNVLMGGQAQKTLQATLLSPVVTEGMRLNMGSVMFHAVHSHQAFIRATRISYRTSLQEQIQNGSKE